MPAHKTKTKQVPTISLIVGAIGGALIAAWITPSFFAALLGAIGGVYIAYLAEQGKAK